ncbi:MAG: hypothetical protein AAFM91_16925 [Pseudomonadota bacterium]
MRYLLIAVGLALVSSAPAVAQRVQSEAPNFGDYWFIKDQLDPVFRAATPLLAARRALEELGYSHIESGEHAWLVRRPDGTTRAYVLHEDAIASEAMAWSSVVTLIAEFGLSSDDFRVIRNAIRADPGNATLLNNAAWAIATQEIVFEPMAELAIAYASRAADSSNRPADYLDTLAAAQAARGNTIEAVATQREAITKAGDNADDGMLERLDRYTQGQHWVEQRGIEPVWEDFWQWAAQNDVSESFDHFRDDDLSLVRKAESGDAAAQWLLAEHYLGTDVSRVDGLDSPGLYWLRQAADAGQSEALNELGYAHLHGVHGLPINDQLAEFNLRKAVAKGESVAAYNLINLHREYFRGDRERQIAYWTERAASMGLVHAKALRAFQLRTGYGNPVDIEEAVALLNEIEREGYSAADFFSNLSLAAILDVTQATIAKNRFGEVSYEALPDAMVTLADWVSDTPDPNDNGQATFALQQNDTTLYFSVAFDDISDAEVVINLELMAAELGSLQAVERLIERLTPIAASSADKSFAEMLAHFEQRRTALRSAPPWPVRNRSKRAE